MLSGERSRMIQRIGSSWPKRGGQWIRSSVSAGRQHNASRMAFNSRHCWKTQSRRKPSEHLMLDCLVFMRPRIGSTNFGPNNGNISRWISLALAVLRIGPQRRGSAIYSFSSLGRLMANHRVNLDDVINDEESPSGGAQTL